MRCILLLSIFLFYGVFLFSQNTNQYQIKPCDGFGPLVIQKSTVVSTSLIEGVKFDEESSSSLACDEHSTKYHSRKILKNEEYGLELHFTSETLVLDSIPELVLSRIIISKPICRFSNDITIGISTKEEVLKAFGNKGVVDDYSINYPEKGLLFIFDAKQILTQIRLYGC